MLYAFYCAFAGLAQPASHIIATVDAVSLLVLIPTVTYIAVNH